MSARTKHLLLVITKPVEQTRSHTLPSVNADKTENKHTHTHLQPTAVESRGETLQLGLFSGKPPRQ